jgi:hypothetical protein
MTMEWVQDTGVSDCQAICSQVEIPQHGDLAPSKGSGQYARIILFAALNVPFTIDEKRDIMRGG